MTMKTTESTHKEMKDNVDEDDVILEQLRETLRQERERERDLVGQHVRLARQDDTPTLQNRKLEEERATSDARGGTDSGAKTVSSGRRNLR